MTEHKKDDAPIDNPPPTRVKVTAAGAHERWFTNSQWWRHGYVEAEVDDYLDEVEETLDYYEKMRDQIVEALLNFRGDNLELRRTILQFVGVSPPPGRIDLGGPVVDLTEVPDRYVEIGVEYPGDHE